MDRFGDDEAVVDGTDRLSFRDLAERVDLVARALVGSGIEPGDRVAVWAPNSAAWVVTSFAVYVVGAVLVPLNTRYRGEEAGHVLRTSRARLLFAVTDLLGSDLVALLAGVSGLEALEEIVVLDGPPRPGHHDTHRLQRPSDRRARSGGGRAAGAAVTEHDASDIIFTSGTTGTPKGAVLGHGASVRTYLAWSELVGLRRGDRYLVVYPFFHTAGLKSAVLACVLRGATILPHAVFDVVPVMERVAAERITMLPGPPTVFQSILNHPDFASFDLSSLRLSVTGAATIPVDVIRRMRDELRFETVVTGYGLTETTGTVSMCRHDDPPEVIATTVGRPLPGVRVRIADDAGEPVAPGQPGEILVRGFNVMKEYFEDPKATEEAIDAEGWLRTGDIGFLGRDGNLRITDRKKDMYIVGGFNAVSGGDRGHHGRPPAGGPGRRGRRPRCASGGGRGGVRRSSSRSHGRPGRARGLVPGPHGELQGPAVGTRRRLAPAEPDGQGDEVRAACPAHRVIPGADGVHAVVRALRQVQATIGPAAPIISDS